MITQQTHQYFRLYQHYQNGVLPYSGGILDQPNVYAEAMEILDSYGLKLSG